MTMRILVLGCFLVAAGAAGGSPVRRSPPPPPHPLPAPSAFLPAVLTRFAPFTQDRGGGGGGRIMLHDTTIDVPSGIEHHPSGPDAPNAPHAPETRARRLLLAAAKRDQPPFAPVPAWWRGSRDATLHLVHLPNADALGTLRDAMDDAGEIAGYVPSSAYLVVVRDNAVLAELLPKVPGAWTTELKPHHKISPNLLLIDDGIDGTEHRRVVVQGCQP